MHQALLVYISSTAALFTAAMETFYNIIPLETWPHNYTDGLKLDMDGVPGAGFRCELFSLYLSLGMAEAAFDNEVEANKVDLVQLEANEAKIRGDVSIYPFITDNIEYTISA